MLPLVSIIVASYNKQLFISETIESVISQTYVNWELVIVDDNSNDDTVSIIKHYVEKDKRIILYTNDVNKGANFCRNFGLQKAKGKHVIFLDADDLLLKTCLENRVKKATEFPDANLLVFSMGVFYKNIGDKADKEWTPNTKTPLQDFLKDKLPWSIVQPIWRKDFLLDLGGFNESFPKLQDVELHTRALLHTSIGLKTFPELIDCYYRIDDNRKTFSNKEFLMRRAMSARMYCDAFKDRINVSLKKYLFGTVFGTYETVIYCLKTKQISYSDFKTIETELFSADIMKKAGRFKKMLFKIYFHNNSTTKKIIGLNKIIHQFIIS